MHSLFNLLKKCLALALFLVFALGAFYSWSAVADETDLRREGRLFRFLSYVYRDSPPSVEEARRFFATKDLTAFKDEWEKSPEFKSRIKRVFGEILFTRSWADYFPGFRLNLKKDPVDGVYYLVRKGRANCGAVVESTAWWSDTKVRVCTDAAIPAYKITVGTKTEYCSRSSNAGCGCGPDLIFCKPSELESRMLGSVHEEFENRGIIAYEKSWSWNDLIRGNEFYGNRHLFHTYLHKSGKMSIGDAPLQADLDTLKSLPLDTPALAAFPSGPGKFYGYITSPGFLVSYNNHRTRVRALTERLLCRDVDPALNTAGLTTFLNADLSAADKAHGNKQGCAECHYGLDNFASGFFNWSQSASFESWTKPKSQVFSIFGVQDENLGALADALIDKSPWFHECMAKRVWDNLSGGNWSLLQEASQKEFVTASKQGPRPLFEAILNSKALREIRTPVP
jgi:hypothetical protein